MMNRLSQNKQEINFDPHAEDIARHVAERDGLVPSRREVPAEIADPFAASPDVRTRYEYTERAEQHATSRDATRQALGGRALFDMQRIRERAAVPDAVDPDVAKRYREALRDQ